VATVLGNSRESLKPVKRELRAPYRAGHDRRI